MDTAQSKLAFQVQLWGLIGPFIALITSFVILIKSPPEAIYLSIATIVGLIASSKWKMKGAFFSIGFMLVFYLYHFSEIDPNEHFWHIGMNLSIILGFAITALGLQEVEELLHFGEKSIPLETIKSEDLRVLQDAVAAKNSELISYGALVETMRKEAIQASKQHEKLLQDFMDKQRELSHVQEGLHAAKQEIQELNKRQIEDVTTLELKKKEIEELKAKLELLKVEKELPKMTSNINAEAFSELKNTNELLSRERGRLESLLFRTQIDLHQKTENLANLPQLEKEIEDLKNELQVKLGQEEIIQNKLQQIEKELVEESNKKEALFAALEEKEQILIQESTKKEALVATLKEKEELLGEESNKKEALFAALEEKEQILIQESTKQEALISALKEKEELLNVELKAKQELEAFNHHLKRELDEKAKLQAADEVVVIPSLISAEKLPFELKKVEGRYQQLREQFELKSDVLDETRKELFSKEESLLEAKLYLNELQLYHFSDSEAAMQAYLLAVIEESNKEVHHLEQEIKELQVFIQNLLK